MNGSVYRDEYLNQISFPFGGPGTGSIGLAGNGRLIDLEIFNGPNKGSVNGFSDFAVKAEGDGKLLDARILYDGQLWAEFPDEGGTRFVISLPVNLESY